jgi:hypothetical protein
MSRSVKKIENVIERKSQQRRKAMRGEGRSTVAELDADVQELYGELRVARAQSRHGARDDIVRNARIERELEKLMS